MALTHDQELVRRVIAEIVNAGRLAVADELFTRDYVNHGGLIPDLVCGPEAIKLSVAVYRRAFPDLHVTIDALRPDRDLMVVHWTARNRCQAARPATEGGPTSLDRVIGITRVRCTHGQIVESWTGWDSAAVLHRAGLTASAGAAPGMPSTRG